MRDREDKDQQMKQVASCGAGLYVKCKVNGVPVERLVDTGATLTIISTRLWNTIQQCSSPLLEKFSSQVFTASGEPVEIKGKTTVFIDIDGMHYTCKVVVADIDLDLIMGLDFFMDLNSRFDASMKTLGKRLEVMKKKNELSLLQNEILSLESELRDLEMHDEQVHREESRDERPRRHLPDIPFGRRDHVTISDIYTMRAVSVRQLKTVLVACNLEQTTPKSDW